MVSEHEKGKTMETEKSGDAGYFRAIQQGIVAGWIGTPIVLVALISIAAPDSSWAFRLGAAIMTGFWVGLFFGGTVAVTAYGMRLEREHASQPAVDPVQETSSDSHALVA